MEQVAPYVHLMAAHHMVQMGVGQPHRIGLQAVFSEHGIEPLPLLRGRKTRVYDGHATFAIGKKDRVFRKSVASLYKHGLQVPLSG